MKDSKLTFDRRIEMLFMLINKRKSNLPELANIFCVSKNTVYKDIVFLSRYAPIYTKTGRNGGVYILEEYRNSIFVYLSKDEKQVLTNLMEKLPTHEKATIRNILNKFSMPT